MLIATKKVNEYSSVIQTVYNSIFLVFKLLYMRPKDGTDGSHTDICSRQKLLKPHLSAATFIQT